ncbi:MAG: sialate O-acetylesterase [Planctomycetota bacterium]|nr:sialate O-acetylesterase [Planctomycetota bacterium]
MKKIRTSLVVSVLLALSGVASAGVKPHPLISDGAVLQQGVEAPVWGTANDGEKITVKFQGQEISNTAINGRWLVKLEPLKPGGPFTMTIDGENSVVVNDLLVGEVWICSGQSNMAFQLLGASNAKEAIDAATDPLLRLCTVRTARGDDPQTEVPVIWRSLNKSGPAFANNFSAVGYFFGRDLRKALNVPVGLIHGSVGATAICWWMNQQAFEVVPELKVPIEAECKHNTAVLYNGMIAPLQPHAIRGAIWYQGESDKHHPDLYRKLFPAMIQGWRKAWGLDFPFLFVQVAPCANWLPEIREAQLISWQKTRKTAMVVTTDCGDPTEIHPPNKEPVGARLALAARAVAYGETVEYSGPIYESMNIEGDHIVLSFKHVGTRLEARGGDLKGFTIAGADKKFVTAAAKIEGDTVVVSSAEIPRPVAVRYGWANVPEVNLFNKEGLPASPFRTDLAMPR